MEAGEVGDDHIAAVCRTRRTAFLGLPRRQDKANGHVRHAREQDAQFVAVVEQTITDCLIADGNFTDEDRTRRRGLVSSVAVFFYVSARADNISA